MSTQISSISNQCSSLVCVAVSATSAVCVVRSQLPLCTRPENVHRICSKPGSTSFDPKPIIHALVMCCLVAIVMAQQRPQVTDTALEDALNDKRFIQRQLKCALGEGPCDPIGKRLKTLAPLVLRGACPQCTPQETKQIQHTLSYVQRNYPQQWAKIVRQYSG